MKRMMLIAAAAVTMIAATPRKDAYIISTGDNTTFNAGTSLAEFDALSREHSGRFIWVRRGGREYVISDETTILRAEALFAPDAAVGIEEAALGREESRLDREEERLDEAPRSAARDQRLAGIRAQQRALERREKELDEKEEQVEREAESAFWPLVEGAIRSGVARRLAH